MQDEMTPRSSGEDDSASAGTGRADFVTFRVRLLRLVDSLVALRHLPGGAGNTREQAEVKLEAGGVTVTFTLGQLPWPIVLELILRYQKAFAGLAPLMVERPWVSSLNFFATERGERFRQANADERVRLGFSRSRWAAADKIEIFADPSRFDDHFEVFVDDAAKLLFPPIETPKTTQQLDLDAWHEEFDGQFERRGCRVLHETGLGWQDLAGLEAVRERLERAVLLPLTREALYQKVAHAVMPTGVSVLPRGVLLTGPPGTGKTWSMRALAGEAQLPVVALPCEALMTKWYGESERRLASVFRLCRQAGRMVLFIDELDALARHRNDSHEATARMVSILLAELDGLAGRPDILLVGSANDTEAIDRAVLDRFDLRIEFDLPDHAQRRQVLAYYARQLPTDDVCALAARMDGWSIRQIARFAESVVRSYVSALDLSQLEAREPPVPRIEDYVRELGVADPATLSRG